MRATTSLIDVDDACPFTADTPRHVADVYNILRLNGGRLFCDADVDGRQFEVVEE